MTPEEWEDAAAEEAERRAAILEERYEARRADTRARLGVPGPGQAGPLARYLAAAEPPEPRTIYAAYLSAGDLLFRPEDSRPVEVMASVKGPVIHPDGRWRYTITTDDGVTEPYIGTELVQAVRLDRPFERTASPRSVSNNPAGTLPAPTPEGNPT